MARRRQASRPEYEEQIQALHGLVFSRITFTDFN